MSISSGHIVFLVAPLILASVLLRLDPSSRRVRLRSLLLYVIIMSAVILGALELVAYVASGQVRYSEIAVILWFTITWRLAWAIWVRTVGRLGQARVRWARWRRRQRLPAPRIIRFIPLGRACLTATVFFSAFLSVVVTHRFKLDDGQDPTNTLALPFESVRIPTSDRLNLAAWFVPDEGAQRTIIVCHGAGANKGNFVWFLSPLVFHGYNVVMFDFRAHGGSDGRTTTYGIREKEDVRAVVDWLKRERPEQSRCVVGLGSSQGAMALALAAADDPRIDAIILDSPFTSPRELVLHHARRLPVIGPLTANLLLAEVSLQTWTSFFAASAEDAVRRMAVRPLLVIHGDSDFVMPPEHSQRLYDAAKGPRDIWFGPGPHSNIVTTDPYEYGERVFSFLDKALGPAPRPARKPTATRPHKSTATAPATR